MTRWGQVVAIKVLDLEATDDDLAEIQREISILGACGCQYITRYHCSFMVDMSLWIVMDYAGGGSVRAIMKLIERLDERFIVPICKGILMALSYLHSNNIIHRDIKAANVLLTDDGSVKLCDFGVAGEVTRNNLKRNTFTGTPYWMAPEVIRRSKYDFKADIWSLGVTVFEMATGNPPLADKEPLRAVFLIPRNPPARLPEEYSKPLKEFVALTLNDDPVARPSADDLLKSKLMRQKCGDLLELVQLYKEDHHQSDDEFALEKDLTVMSEWDFQTIKSPAEKEVMDAIAPRPQTAQQNVSITDLVDQYSEQLDMGTITPADRKASMTSTVSTVSAKSVDAATIKAVSANDGNVAVSLPDTDDNMPLNAIMRSRSADTIKVDKVHFAAGVDDQATRTGSDLSGEDSEILPSLPGPFKKDFRLSRRHLLQHQSSTSTSSEQSSEVSSAVQSTTSTTLPPNINETASIHQQQFQSTFQINNAVNVNVSQNPELYQKPLKPPRIDKIGWNRTKMDVEFDAVFEDTLSWLTELESLVKYKLTTKQH